MKQFRAYTPEELFVVNPEAPNKISIDAINCVLERARAITVTMILDDQSDNGLSQEVMNNLAWALQGYIDQIDIMINHADKKQQV